MLISSKRKIAPLLWSFSDNSTNSKLKQSKDIDVTIKLTLSPDNSFFNIPEIVIVNSVIYSSQ
jgi:hypothetical protein